ncbi:MAG: hypothetical protein OEX06_02275, partial [Candidatus Bathyarchaeota archaeon]|nr:hypothetical protein [Candidatus Bathyarchaeota archaeon]
RNYNFLYRWLRRKSDRMPRKKQRKKKQTKKVGIEAVVEPGVGALYVRGTWMKKLKEIDKRKRKPKKMQRK